MCKSLADGGGRCPHWYQERVEAKERALEKSNMKVVQQIVNIQELEAQAKVDIKELKQKIFFTNITRDQERAQAKIRKINDNIRKNKELLRSLKDRSGDIAEELEEAHTTLDLVKERDNMFVADKLGNANLVAEFAADSQEWHDQRSRGYGGSDIAGILRIPGAKTNYDTLFKMKTGEIVSKPGSTGAAKVGHQFEPVIFRRFAKNHPDKKVLVSNGSWVNKDRAYQLANVDGLICENGSETPNAILEIKTSSDLSHWKNKETGDFEVPKYYRAQVLWYMSTFGIKKGYLAAFVNHEHYLEFEIEAEPGEIGNMHKKVQEFRDKVKKYNKVEELVAA